MQKKLLLIALILCCTELKAQLFSKPVFSGIYLQWGYSRDKYTKSDIHLHNGATYDFTLHDAVAKDKPDFDGFKTNPLDVTIPQNVIRIGVYLNKAHTHAIELNYDHAKYVVQDNQRVHITGQIHGEQIDKDTTITPWLIHFEHSNGANFYHLNYVGQQEIWKNKKRRLATAVWKLGAGVVIPKSDVTVFGKRLDNRFHVAGYILGAETGLRIYPLKNLFLETTVKGGFANYLNVLTVEGGSANHHFLYGEVTGSLGYDINFRKKKKADAAGQP